MLIEAPHALDLYRIYRDIVPQSVVLLFPKVCLVDTTEWKPLIGALLVSTRGVIS